jgi:hypothetical protein
MMDRCWSRSSSTSVSAFFPIFLNSIKRASCENLRVFSVQWLPCAQVGFLHWQFILFFGMVFAGFFEGLLS